MNKRTYLEKAEVKSFIKWLSEGVNRCSSDFFLHTYEIEPRGKSTLRRQWECHGIFHAFERYEWAFTYEDCEGNTIKGSSYSDSATALNNLKKKLMSAVEKGDNEACYKVCVMILKWGGVLGSDHKGNKKKLLKMRSYLASYLSKVQEYFNGDCELLSRYSLDLRGLGVGLERSVDVEMNAGFTKIYSLLCKNFIIYDGRVGAALGHLVVQFLRSTSELDCREVPNSLSFYYGKAKNNKVNRNPSDGNYIFKSLSTSSSIHIRNNLKANWILGELFLGKIKGFSEQENPLRSFEAALFMIGYRIKC